MRNRTKTILNNFETRETLRKEIGAPDQRIIEIKVGEGSIGNDGDIAAIIRTLQDAGLAVERGDPNGVAAMFHEDDKTVLFDYLAPGLTTVADIRRNVANMASNAIGEVSCRYPKVTVRILSDDLAYSMAYSEINVVTAAGRIDNHTSVTNIWRRIDGRWLAIHEHSSVPVNPVTGKADLKQPI